MSRLPRPRIILAATAGVLLLAYVLIALGIAWGATRADREEFEAAPEDYGLAYEEVVFPSRGDDVDLRGWLLDGDEGAPYLIFVHGLGGQRTGDNALEIASALIDDDGYNVLLFDLRAHGTSGGGRVTAGDSERMDVLGAYDFVVSRGAEPGQIGLMGFSFGAGVALMAAAQEPGVDAVVADSPFADVRDLLAQEAARKTPIPEFVAPIFLPAASVFADLLYGIDLGDVRPERDVAGLAYPVLLIHGEADSRIPVSHSRRILDAAPAGSQLWTVPGADHVDAFLEEPEEYLRRVREYFERRLDDSRRVLLDTSRWR
jgi:pimeloyl-ACP methyl ester carboxylesterase